MDLLEQAHSIIDNFSERQLKGFVDLFSESLHNSFSDNQNRREEAVTNLNNLRRSIPDLDEKAELEEYRTQRFTLD